MFLTPEDESELLSKYKTNNHSDVLRSVSALPQTEAAKILRNSVVFGVPAADVAENPTAFDKGIAKQPNWFEVEHQYPKTAAFLYDPLNMAIVRTPENVRHLTTLETLIMPGFATKEGVKDLVRGNLAWWKGIRESQVYDKIGPQPEDMLLSGKGLAPLQKPDTSDIDKAIGKLAPDTSVQPDGKIAQYIYDVQRGTPQFVGQIAIGALTKSFSPAGRVLAQAGAMMPQIAGGDYLNLTGQGVEPERAFKAAMADAVTQSLLEGISFEAIIGGHLAKGVAKYLPKHAANLKAPVTVGLSALSEAFTETIQKYPEAMAEIWAKYANLSPREQAEKFVDDLWNITKEGLYEGAVAAPFGAVGGVVSVYANKFKEKKTQAEIDKIEKVQAAVTRSGLPGVSPELVANFVNSVNDETVFADPNALKLMQMEMPEVMERLNIEEEAIDEAIKSGQLIEISMGDYVAATTSQPEIHAQLKEHITVSEDGETLSRLRDIAAKPRNKQELSEARREVQAQQAELKSAQKEMYDEAVAAGMKADEAKNLVAIATANSRIASAGKGVNHAQWFRENRPMIRKGREMAAGAMGQFAGPFARTADKLQYEKAKSMLTEGRSAEEVRKATGWFKGMDGKMRFEIDDSKASFNPEIAKNKLSVIDAIKDFKVGFGREAKMGDILQHDMLYAAYPWIREIKVVAGDINDHGASYNTKTNTITIGRGLGFKPDNKVMGQFMHEIQHAIQTEEGFARGGSPDEFAKAYNKLKEMRPRIIKMLREALDAKDMEKFRRILQEDKRVQRQLIALTGKDGLVGVDQYEQLAGEIEARDTAARANMGANERMESQPARSEDAIVVWNGHEIMFQEDYRGSHTAPTKKGGEHANPLHDISTVYPADIYGPMAGRYYGDGDKDIDDQSLRIIQQLRHNPNAKVTVYRAIPKGVDGDINAGDWVTINPQYAKMHGDHALNGKYKVIKKSVYARDIYTDGNSIHEWGYDPQPEVSKEEIAALKNRQRMYQSATPTDAEAKLKQDEVAFAQAVDDFVDEKLTGGQPIKVMTTPLVMSLVNAQILPVYIDSVIMAKVVKEKHKDGISDKILKQIPRKLTDPLAIFKNRDKDKNEIPDEVIVLVDLNDNLGNPIIVPFVFNAKKDRHEINKIKTIFGKGNEDGVNFDWFSTALAKRDLLYINKQRGLPVLQRLGHQSSMRVTLKSSSIQSIPNEHDLDKLKNDNPTLYQSAKGSIHWENGRAIISLFRNADASTGIHELLGHYMTQTLLDLGAQADAPEWMKQDRRAMLEWAGVADWDSATKEEKVAAHEKWARAAEAYIMEGKAPSMELRGVFRRFADWLQQVYRSIKELGVEVSPEMRGVFDRMLATEEEINQAAWVNNFAIENPEIYEGLSDNEKNKLVAQMDKILERGKEILVKELMTDISAERKAAVEAERIKFEAQAREEISNQPLYRMIRELRKPSVRNPVNELTKQWQKKVDDLAHYLRDNHGNGVENVSVYDGDQNDEQAKKEGFYRVTHNTKWYQDIYKETGKAPTLGRLKMLAEDFLRNGFDDVADRVPPDYEFVEIEKQLEELQKEPQALPIVRKINTVWLKENYPDEIGTFAFMHSNLGQYTLDDLAGFYGFSSADEIVYKVKSSPPFGQAVQNAVDAKIAESFPALFRDKEAVRAAAEAAIYNEESASLLAIQLSLIDEKRGKIMNAEETRKQAMQDRELARQSAVKSIAKMSLDRAMRLTTWIAAERRAAENVEKAVSEKDWATAFEQKTIQLYNHAMVTESLRTRREFDRINKFFNRQKGSDVDGWISMEKAFDGTVTKNNSHFLQAAMLLKRMGFERKDGLKPEETFAQYVKRMETENPDICNIAEWLTFDSGTRSPREMTLTQLQDVEQALKNIKTMARAGMNSDGFYTLNGDGKMATVAELSDTAEANVKDRQIDLPDKVNNDTLAARVAGFVAGLRKPSKWMLELDGFKNFGIWAKTLYYSLSDADGFKSRLIATVNAKLEAAYERAGISKEQRYQDAHKKTYVPEWGTSVTRNYMREVLLHMGSESNMQRLFSRPPVGINGEWNRESVTAVLTKHLDAKEFRLAQDVWDAIDLYDEYTKMVKKVTGSELRKVNPTPIAFTLPTGETVHLRGGYYHLKADPRSSTVAELREEKELGSEPGRMPYPNTGASKERASSATYAVDLERSNIYSSVAAQAHDIAFRPVMLDINKLMRDERVRDTMRRKLGDASYKAFMKWLKVVGSGKNSTVEGSGWLDSMATAIRQRSIVANLLFRPGTVFQNAANPTLYGNSVDGFNNSDALAAYMKYGVADYIPKALSFSEEAEAIRQEVYALSVMMRDKMENPDYSLRDMHNRKGGFLLDHEATRKVGAKLAITHDNVLKFGSGLLAFTDQLTDIPMWRGAYYKAMTDGKSQADAVRFADTVIESSTGSGRTIDSSLMQLGSPTEKLLSMFMSFINTQYNRWANEFGIYAKDHDHMRLLTFLGTQYLLFGTLSALASGKWKKDDEDWLEWYAKEVLEWPLSMIPAGGSMMKYVFDSKAGFQTFAWTASPAERNMGQLLKTAVSLGKNDAERSAEDVMQAAAFLFGYPDQFNDWLWNLYDVSANGMEPQFRDLIRRRPKRER